MTDNTPNELFFANTEMDESQVVDLTSKALIGMDDGELFLEYKQSEALMFDDGRLKSASFDTDQGFGLRGICGEATGYAHASELTNQAILRATETVQAVRAGHSGNIAVAPPKTNQKLYTDSNPLMAFPFEKKVKLLEEMDAYARSKDPCVRQVSASLAGSWQVITVIRPDGSIVSDTRPLVRINVQIVAGKGDRLESGSYGTGGRTGFDEWVNKETWQASVDEAIRQALINLDSIEAPAGEMTVVLGPGWPGILLHEAIGHGLEGDFNRKNTSAFSNLMGQRIAAPGVNVIDDGTLLNRRGSLTVDDEGTPTKKTLLIEDGILTNYLHDRLNSRLMGMEPTGNGRRESYAHMPMPRMTNTYMLSGQQDSEELIRSVDNGLYAVNFGGGQVDITSGKFVFSCTEAYKINNGQVDSPVKGATLIGDGPEVLKKISGIGNDMLLDPGIGTCGKNGQGVPVGVGLPTLRIDGLTVGGTATP